MGVLLLVHHALNLSIMDAGILKKVQHASLMIFSLSRVGYPMSFLSTYHIHKPNPKSQIQNKIKHYRRFRTSYELDMNLDSVFIN